jgi:glycosyltransferase involved in cell wall biosynthesis
VAVQSDSHTTKIASGKRIGMVLYGDLTYDSRVRREAATLARSGYEVRLACLGGATSAPDLPPGVTVLPVVPPSRFMLPGDHAAFDGGSSIIVRAGRRISWLKAYATSLRAWGGMAIAACGAVDIWYLHDMTALVAVTTSVDREKPIIYDTHELFLDRGIALRLPKALRQLLRAYEGRLISRAAVVVTVNQDIARVLLQRYHPRDIVVVHNCPDRWIPPVVRPTLIRDAAGIPSDAPVVLYHGSLGPNRGIEQIAAAIQLSGLERAHFVLLGFGESREQYLELAGTRSLAGRMHVLEAVTPDVLPMWIASADVGTALIEASTLNHYLSTPNKLFESLGAGIPVVASDFPAMRRIVLADPYLPLGAVCDPSRVDQIAAALRSIIELDADSAAGLRARCLAAAQSTWNWENESKGLIDLIGDVMARHA